MSALPYRADIDALRGVSVLLVVFYHAFPDLIPGGFIGVDVFFVISGYLITTIIVTSLSNDNFSLREFYAKRIRRLFPALLTVLIFALVIGWLILFPDEYKQLAYHVQYSAIYWLNFILIGETGYFDVGSIYKPLLHLWTLSVEEQYYIVWPLVLLLIFKQQYLKPIQIIALVALVSFAANIHFIATDQESVYFHTVTRIWQLASGSILSLYLVDNSPPDRKPLLFTGVLIILLSALVIDDLMMYPGWLAVLPTIGAVLFIYSNTKYKQWGGLVSIGLVSYPLYLWHWVIISFLYIYLGRSPSNTAVVIAVLLSGVFAYLTYRFIEKLRYVKSASVPMVMLFSMVFLGLIGTYISRHDGLADRGHLSYLADFQLEFKRTPITDDTCIEYAKSILAGELLFDYCRAENLDREKFIAVIGDSHAHVIFPGIAEQASERNYGTILLANSSCPTLKGFLWGRNETEIPLCQKKIDQILAILKKDQKVEKVLVVTRGPVYIHGEVEGEFTRDSVLKSLSVKKNPLLTYETYATGLSNTLSILEDMESVKSAYYFLENPELDFLPKETIVRPFDKWEVSTQEATMDKELYLSRMDGYRRSVERVAKSFRSTRILDPMPFLCPEKKCLSFKAGNFLYADDDHFSVFGSKFIAKKISGEIFEDRT